ncbi:ETX/MTX2 family pore-forming toxin [Bacillus thuringiensis]|nr:ETX/MTX2 family pore-forming toxin [Bacillus thuringiensis]
MYLRNGDVIALETEFELSSLQPIFSGTQTHTNNSYTLPFKKIFSFAELITESETAAVTTGVEIGTEISVDASFGFTIKALDLGSSITALFSESYNYSDSLSQTTTTSRSWTDITEVEIPPRTKVIVRNTILGANVQSAVRLEGDITPINPSAKVIEIDLYNGNTPAGTKKMTLGEILLNGYPNVPIEFTWAPNNGLHFIGWGTAGKFSGLDISTEVDLIPLDSNGIRKSYTTSSPIPEHVIEDVISRDFRTPKNFDNFRNLLERFSN